MTASVEYGRVRLSSVDCPWIWWDPAPGCRSASTMPSARDGLLAQVLPVSLGALSSALRLGRLPRGVWRCVRVVVQQILAHSEELLGPARSQLLRQTVELLAQAVAAGNKHRCCIVVALFGVDGVMTRGASDHALEFWRRSLPWLSAPGVSLLVNTLLGEDRVRLVLGDLYGRLQFRPDLIWRGYTTPAYYLERHQRPWPTVHARRPARRWWDSSSSEGSPLGLLPLQEPPPKVFLVPRVAGCPSSDCSSLGALSECSGMISEGEDSLAFL